MKTPSCFPMTLQQDNHNTGVISCCKAKSALAFDRAAIWEDSLPLKTYWWNPEQKKKNLMWGQWVKVLAYLCSAWNCVQWKSSCHKAAHTGTESSSEKWENVNAIYGYARSEGQNRGWIIQHCLNIWKHTPSQTHLTLEYNFEESNKTDHFYVIKSQTQIQHSV